MTTRWLSAPPLSGPLVLLGSSQQGGVGGAGIPSGGMEGRSRVDGGASGADVKADWAGEPQPARPLIESLNPVVECPRAESSDPPAWPVAGAAWRVRPQAMAVGVLQGQQQEAAAQAGCSWWQVLPRGRASPWQPLGSSVFCWTSTSFPRDPRCTSGEGKSVQGSCPSWSLTVLATQALALVLGPQGSLPVPQVSPS